MRIKQGTTIPYAYQIKDEEGNPLDLTLCEKVEMTGLLDGDTALTINGQCDIVDATNGDISYPWNSGETDVLGMYRIEFILTYVGGKIAKVPSNAEEWLLIMSSGIPT
jgi:hypothetical protein